MTIGTRSVLYGYHCLAIHWVFVAMGWLSVYGFRVVRVGTTIRTLQYARVTRAVWTSILDPRLWVAFLVHDMGYWGAPNMDGAEGERHPEVGARLMRRWFGEPWGEFCLYHSRFYAKRDGAAPSPLCYADKEAFLKYPTWLIVLLVTLSGERHEYMANHHESNPGMPPIRNTWDWARSVKQYVAQWVAEHKDGAPDLATPVREHV